MPDTAPTEFADMNQPFESAEIDKCAKIAQIGDRTLRTIPRMEPCENLGALTRFDSRCAF